MTYHYNHIQMGKLKFTLSNILFWLSIASTCLLLEDVGFLTTSPKGPLGESFFFMLLVLSMGGFLSYFLIEHIKNKVKVDYVLITVLLTGFICGLISIYSFTGVSFTGVKTFEYSISRWDQVHQMLLLMVYLVTIYAVLFYFNRNHPSIRKLQVVYFIIVAITLLGTIYSWIMEYDAIIYNLSGKTDPMNVYSIFWNPNMFSLMILLGMFSCFGLNYFKKRIIWFLLIIYFTLMICFVASLTSIIVCVAALVIYFLLEIIFAFRRHRKRAIFDLTIYLVVITGFVTLYACALNFDLGHFSLFCKSVYEYFSLANYASLSNRTFIWDCASTFLKDHPMSFALGVGFKNSFSIVGGMLYAYRGGTFAPISTHNGFIQVLMNFGLVGIIFYALFFAYYVYCILRVFKKDARFALIFGLIGFALLGYAVMESVIFLNPNTLGLLICAFFYLPIMNKWKHYCRPQLGDDVISVDKPQPIPSRLINKSLSKVFMALIVVAVSFFIFPLFREDISLMYLLVNIVVVLVLCAFTVPFIISSIAKSHSRKVGLLLCVINSILVAAPFVYLGIRYAYQRYWFAFGAEWVIPVLLVIVLVGEAIIFGVAKGQKGKDYLATLIGLSKHSFMGLLGAGVIILISYFIIDYFDLVSPLTYIIYPVIVLTSYYLSSYLVPFKDQKEFVKCYNESLLYSMKKDVLKDRLGEYNEKRRD